MRRHLARSLPLIALALASAACSNADDGGPAKGSGWTCERADVPMGEVTRCTQAGAPARETAGSTEDGDLGLRTYGTPPAEDGDAGEAAPSAPADEPGGESATPYECPPGATSPDCPGDVSAPPADAEHPAGPDECGYMPDLPYCAAGAPAPPSAGGGGMQCAKDAQGNKVCETAPSCAPGTHASACGACIADGETDDCVAPAEGGCWITGGGFIVEPSVVPPQAAADGHDNYGGNAKPMKKGGVQGHWNHVDHGTMNHAKGRPAYIFCRHVDEPGPGQPGGKKGFTMNQIYFGGPAEWRVADTGAWQDGYWFDVVAKDHGEPGSQPSPKNGGMVDTYHFTLRKLDDPAAKVSGPIVYEVEGGLVGGNIQIHPPNPGHPGVQSPLPAWVALEP